MNKEQREVASWWNAGREYQQGLMLLARFSKNKVLVHTLMKKIEKFGRGKLEYELPKAVGLNRDRMPKVVAEESSEFKVQSSKLNKESSEVEVQSSEKEKNSSEVKVQRLELKKPGILNTETGTLNSEQGTLNSSYPAVIRRLKYEYSDLYNKRSIMHKQMVAVPAENSQANMNQRAMLFAKIKETTERMDYLYAFEKDFSEKGIIPLEEEIWPTDEKAEEIPTDAEGLKKLKKNLQTYNSKARNMLLYQSKIKTEQEHPMPKGPKRQRVELAIKRRDELIEEIERRLFELERNN